jgi:hypothetical protein
MAMEMIFSQFPNLHKVPNAEIPMKSDKQLLHLFVRFPTVLLHFITPLDELAPKELLITLESSD